MTDETEAQCKQAPPARRYYVAWSAQEGEVAKVGRVWARGTDALATLLTGMTRFDNELVSNPDGTPERSIRVTECTKACYIWLGPTLNQLNQTGQLFWLQSYPALIDVDLAYTPDEEPTRDPALAEEPTRIPVGQTLGSAEPSVAFYGAKLPKCSSSSCNTEAVWEVPWDAPRATYYLCDTCFHARTPGRLDGTPKRLLLVRPGIDDA